MITLEIHFFGSYGGGKKNLKKSRLMRLFHKKKEFLKKIVAKKFF